MAPDTSMLDPAWPSRWCYLMALAAMLSLSGCATYTRAASGLPKSELAVLEVPKYFKEYIVYIAIDGEVLEAKNAYYITVGNHVVDVIPGFFFQPGGTTSVTATCQSLYRLNMERIGAGSMTQYKFSVTPTR